MTPNIHHVVTSSTGAMHDLVIHRAHVFDGHRPLAGLHDVAIRDGTIAAVSPERSRRTSDRLSGTIEIDAAAGWVMPGLIDTHVHVYDVAAVRDSDSMQDFEERTLPGLLEDFLQHGVTTIKSVGDPTIEILKTRHGIASGALRGPPTPPSVQVRAQKPVWSSRRVTLPRAVPSSSSRCMSLVSTISVPSAAVATASPSSPPLQRAGSSP